MATSNNPTGRYIVRPDGKVVPEPDLLTWAMWMETGDFVVKQEHFGGTEEAPEYMVSTIFLGLDYNMMRQGPPLLWETMAFKYLKEPKEFLGRKYFREPLFTERCSGNREQAEAMHAAMVAKIEALVKDGVRV